MSKVKCCQVGKRSGTAFGATIFGADVVGWKASRSCLQALSPAEDLAQVLLYAFPLIQHGTYVFNMQWPAM